MTDRRLLVAVHDVTPAHEDGLERIFRLLDGLGVTRPALLVVPNWHGDWSLMEHTSFVEMLSARQAAGAEILLHGFRHDESGHQRTAFERLRVFGRTAGAAEFMGLRREEATARLNDGLEMLDGLGLQPTGFVPPAWIFGHDTLSLLRQRGLDITEGFWRILNTSTGRSVFAPALSWSTARRWRSAMTAKVAALRAGVEQIRAIVRIAIHPPDIAAPIVAGSLERTLERLLRVRSATTYREVLAPPGQ